MEIIKLKIKDLTPYEGNAKEHPKKQIEEIKNSIKQFGFCDPVGIWGDKNIIVEGHGRVMALEEMGETEVECIRLDHLTDEERRAYTLAHNKTTLSSDFNFEKLEAELAAIEMDMSQFGFDDFVIEPDTTEDDFDVEEALEEAEEEPISKMGEIYQLGKHRLMVGDSTNIEDVNKLMNGELADCLLTDPPYNVNVSNSEGMTIANDNMGDDEFREFINSAMKCASQSLKKGGAFYVWYGDCEDINFRKACFNNELTVRQCLIWVKNAFNLGRQDYQWRHEPCLYGWRDGASHYFVDDRTQDTIIEDKPNLNKMSKEELRDYIKDLLEEKISTTVIREDKPLKNTDHPTMKPIKLLARQVKNSTKQGELVLDLFGGSGSTLITCEQLNRRCNMMEYDPHYADVIIKRWETLTGKKAELING